MDYLDFCHKIEKSETQPVYCLAGAEMFFLESASNLIIEKVLGENKDNLIVMDATETDIETILDEIWTMSFFGGSKVVFLKFAEKFISKNIDPLLRYVTKPCKDSVLIISTTNVDKRSKKAKTLLKTACTVVCDPPKEKQIVAWIKQRAESYYRFAITPQAAMLLRDLTGGNLMILDKELEKLVTYLGEKKKIGIDEIRDMACNNSIIGAFDLTNAIAEGRKEVALSIIEKVFSEGAKGFELIGPIAWKLRKLLKAKRYQSAGVPMAEILKRMNERYYQREFANQINNLELNALTKGYKKLMECDLGMKTSAADNKILLERLTIELCN